LKKLALYAYCSLAGVVVFAAASTVVFILRPPYWSAYAPILLALGLSSLLYYAPARKNLSSAQVITDSAIIYIQPAILRGQTEPDIEEAEKLREDFGIYVSIFGILLGDKIIMFNHNGIRLRKVEIGRDYISIDYGARDDALQNVRLLYSRPGGNELADIIEKFRYETGVVPVVAG